MKINLDLKYRLNLKQNLKVLLLLIYFLLYCVVTFQVVKDSDTAIELVKILRVLIVFFVFSIQIIENSLFRINYRILLLFTPIVLGFLNFHSLMYLDYIMLVILVVMLFNFKGQEIKLLMKYVSICYFVLLFLLVTNTYLGIIDINNIQETGDRVRNTLGLYNVNASSLILSVSTLLFIITKNSKMLVLSLILSIIVYLYTDTRSILITLFMGCLYLILRRMWREWMGVFSLTLVIISFLIPFIVRTLLGLTVDGIPIDTLTSGRLSFANELVNSFSIKALFVGNFNLDPIDNFSINLFIVVGGFMYFMVYFFLFKNLLKLRDIFLFNIFVSYFVFIGLFESFFSSGNILSVLFFLFLIENSEDVKRNVG